MQAHPSAAYQTNNCCAIAENLVERLELELAIILGGTENVADYWRTPLGVGVGLPKVYWIMCFGKAYSRLAEPEGEKTSFFSRNEFGPGLKTFVSAPSFDAYASAPTQLLAEQRREIGNELFNRLPVQERRGGVEVSWIFSPKNIFRFVRFLYREHTTNWRRFQANVVPEHYRKPHKRRASA